MNEEFEIEIERFIKGEMDEQEVMNFNHRLENDPEFKELYLATLAAHKVVEEAGREELKYNMWSYENTARKKPKVRKLKWQSLISIAASVFIFFVAYTFFDRGGNMTASEVFDTYYEPYSPPSVLRDNSGGGSANWNKAVQHYSAGNFEEALRYFEIAEDNIHFTVVEFYQGMSYLQLDYPDYSDALYYLNEVRLEESVYKEQANWYYGLTLLKKGLRNEAEEVFKQIARERTYNHRRAKEILKINIEN